MFSKVFAFAFVALSFSAQAQAHAAVTPVLGVAGTPKRADVQKPRAATPCGRTNIASSIDSSTPVAAAADGTFTATVTNFNAGRDGSRQVSLTVDATGTGKNFVAGTVSTNGVAAPKNIGSEQIVASLPAGIQCTGGAAGNLCLASFTTSAGFGNCVVVQQGAAAATAATGTGTVAANSTTISDSTTAGNTTTTATGTTGTIGKTGNSRNGNNGNNGNGNTGQTTKNSVKAALAEAQAGTRAPRALLADLEAREESGFEVVKRNVLSWMWA